jgi:mono/diheme cytochrome c family protein
MRKPLFLVAAIALAALTACKDEKPNRGITVLPDMFDSPAIDSQQALTGSVPGKDADGATVARAWQAPAVLMPPEGAISRDGAAYARIPEKAADADKLVNPLLPTTEVLKLGQRTYLAVCATCHGARGVAADAPMADYFAAPSLNDVNVVSYTDGGLYHVISRGRARMMPFAGQLDDRTRWAVVHYLRAQSWAALAVKDVEQVVRSAEAELRLHPDDPKLQAEVSQGKTLLDRRADYQALITAGGDGHDFLPPVKPKPEWQPPTWPGGDPNPPHGGGH